MQRAQQRAASSPAPETKQDPSNNESDSEDEEPGNKGGDGEDEPPPTPEEEKAESIAAPPVLKENLMAPSAADRLQIAKQYIDTLAPASQKKYFSRFADFQVGDWSEGH